MGKINYHDASAFGSFSITLKKAKLPPQRGFFLKIILIIGLFQLYLKSTRHSMLDGEGMCLCPKQYAA